jgi:hypothetical protein
MNTDIRRKINQKHRAHAKARKTKKKKGKDRYKRLQTEVQYEIRKAGKKFMTGLLFVVFYIYPCLFSFLFSWL